jgi:stage V sporulation protein AA
MTGETVYLMIPQITEVYEREVYLKDIGEVHCQNSAVAARVRSVKVTSFKNAGKKGAAFVGNVLDLVKKIEEIDKNIEVNNLGESDFVVKFRSSASPNRMLQWLKTVVVMVTSFCGAAFAIMTFNNDASVTEVFGNIYKLVMGTEADGVTVLELSYSVGLAAGILIFFNHFASWKMTVDPTPIEVEMRLYEENINKTLIINDGRKESGIDVS